MRICIDSNQFILALTQADPEAEELILNLAEFGVFVPRLVMKEVTRNLAADRVDYLHRLIADNARFHIVDASTLPELIEKYVALGLPAKTDALIGAFTAWVGAQYLISDNRRFLSLTTEAFEVLRPGEFLQRWRTGML
jgi:predicted nucleic acid-binding protein